MQRIDKADLIIRGATVIDGTGNQGFRGDIAVRGGKILTVGDCSGLEATEEIRADGLTVAPGFIDAHTHSDTMFAQDSSGASKLYQGITTEISGNCGDSPFPAGGAAGDAWRFDSYADFLRAFSERGCCMPCWRATAACGKA